jgi:hypothetical protein
LYIVVIFLKLDFDCICFKVGYACFKVRFQFNVFFRGRYYTFKTLILLVPFSKVVVIFSKTRF